MLQSLWASIDEALAIGPPELPTEARQSMEAYQAWADGPVQQWGVRRTQVLGSLDTQVPELEAQAPYELGIATALLGYLMETIFVEILNVPIPDFIETDEALLDQWYQVMVAQLQEVVALGFTAYQSCGQAFEALAAPEWAEWAAYCEERAQFVLGFVIPEEEDDEAIGAPTAH